MVKEKTVQIHGLKSVSHLSLEKNGHYPGDIINTIWLGWQKKSSISKSVGAPD